MNFILELLIKVLFVFTAFPVHGYVSAWLADKLGDPTPRYNGKLTLNPMVHIDIFGAIMMVLVGFGWAKPVAINGRNFKNYRVGSVLISLSGPVSSIIMAFISMIIYKVLLYTVGGIISEIFCYIAMFNIGLAVFNLLPIPPLAGWGIISLFISDKTYMKIMQYQQYIFVGLLVVIYSGLLDTPISFIQLSLFKVINFLTSFVDVIFA